MAHIGIARCWSRRVDHLSAAAVEVASMMNAHVLIPLDGSALSRAILDDVSRLFEPARCRITLLCVGELPEAIVAMPPRAIPLDGGYMLAYETEDDEQRSRYPIYANQARDSRAAELEYQLLPHKHELEDHGFDVRLAVRFGDPAEEIVNAAKSERADLIAMSTHGRTGLERLVLGSVAEAVLRRSRVPVLLARPNMQAAADATARSAW
jgi:nucleotide-binding universal stress UspA family protein